MPDHAAEPSTSHTPAASPTPSAAPRWVVYAVTFLGSVGTGAVINGISFIATEVYQFTRVANWSLGIVSSITYIAAALFAGPALRRLRAAWPAWSTRASVIAITLALAACCALPSAITEPWTIWLFMAVYAALAGALWPIVEAFLSGGRRGADLRRTIGGFNIVWAVAVAAAFWMMAPIMPRGPLLIILILGAVHLLTIPLLLLLPREPGRHLDEHQHHDPAEADLFRRLLHGFRVLLLLSYALMSTVNPVLPLRFRDLDIPLQWQTMLASVWMVARVGVFAIMMAWHGWHGRIRTMVWATAAMLLGFAATMLGPTITWLVAGLALLGVGVGAAYSAAIYYAMEVGNAEVDAGGKHEALIGMGYLAGPGLSLAAAAFVVPDQRDPAAAAAVGVLALAMTLAAFRLARPTKNPGTAGNADPGR